MANRYMKRTAASLIEYTDQVDTPSAAVRYLLLNENTNTLYFVFYNETVATRVFYEDFNSLVSTIDLDYAGSLGRYWNDRRLDASPDDTTFTLAPDATFMRVAVDDGHAADPPATNEPVSDEIDIRDIVKATLEVLDGGSTAGVTFSDAEDETHIFIKGSVADLIVDTLYAGEYSVGIGGFTINVSEVTFKP